MEIATIRKALVPVAVSAILVVLAGVGVTEGMTVGEAVTMAVTTFLVWAVPNKQV